MLKLRKLVEAIASVVVVCSAAYILFRLIQSAKLPLGSSETFASVKDSATYAVGFAFCIYAIYACLIRASKYFAIFLETRGGIQRPFLDISIRFLSLVPTPFVIAILISGKYFAELHFLTQNFVLFIAAMLSAAPTAMRIARDGFMGYSTMTLAAATSLGIPKWHALRDIVSLEHASLFRVAATIGVSRVVVENWLALQSTKVISESISSIISDPNLLASSIEQSYASANEKMGALYVILLVALSFSGKIWSLIASHMTKP